MRELRRLLREYRRPWKLFSLACGIGLLIAGSFYYRAPDWDIPISFIMALLAYLTAPWSLRVLLERRWQRLPLMLFLTWFTVDGCYWLYWRQKDPAALEMMRDVNWPASLSLYGMCGLVWLYNGSLRQLLADALRHLPRHACLNYLWAAPCTAVGLLCAGALWLRGGRAYWVDGVLEVAPADSAPRLSLPFNAITLGHVVLGTDHATLAAVRAHEQVHVRQYERWGIFFFVAYPAASLYLWLRGRRPYWDNPFEVEARARTAPPGNNLPH